MSWLEELRAAKAEIDRQLAQTLAQYTPPHLRPLVGLVAEANPVVSMERAGTAARGVASRSATPMQRVGYAGDMLSNMAGVAAPAMAASRAGVPAAQAVEESILGFSRAAGIPQFVADERGALRLFHGSPHDFDKFSMDKIGTGEGKQAEGYGLYFAENKDVAERYRDVLSEKDGAAGRVYEVDIAALPEDFIDFDQPLEGQSLLVRDWFDSRGVSPMFAGNQSGQELMMLERSAMGDEALAESLRAAGVPGVRYRDAGSSVKGQGTRNYVIFDDSLITIVRKYGIAGAAAALGVSEVDVANAMAANAPAYDLDSIDAWMRGR